MPTRYCQKRGFGTFLETFVLYRSLRIFSYICTKTPAFGNTRPFKIGFSSTSIEDRIRNAEKDHTYLMAPVLIVSTYRCFNMNP
ncbi:MAG: GIY-YIG nuclease family protein, partial [Candidatus Pacebacteria bacterium]|nr:GIY-YIG nuclease family protein [Candidatus Paceibacterota bacterium]